MNIEKFNRISNICGIISVVLFMFMLTYSVVKFQILGCTKVSSYEELSLYILIPLIFGLGFRATIKQLY